MKEHEPGAVSSCSAVHAGESPAPFSWSGLSAGEMVGVQPSCAMLIEPQFGLFALAQGGHEAGKEDAPRLVLAGILEYFWLKKTAVASLGRFMARSHCLMEAVEYARETIGLLSRRPGNEAGLGFVGTMLTAVHWVEEQIHVVSIGDQPAWAVTGNGAVSIGAGARFTTGGGEPGAVTSEVGSPGAAGWANRETPGGGQPAARPKLDILPSWACRCLCIGSAGLRHALSPLRIASCLSESKCLDATCRALVEEGMAGGPAEEIAVMLVAGPRRKTE
jgi:hypothetical protein